MDYYFLRKKIYIYLVVSCVDGGEFVMIFSLAGGVILVRSPFRDKGFIGLADLFDRRGRRRYP